MDKLVGGGCFHHGQDFGQSAVYVRRIVGDRDHPENQDLMGILGFGFGHGNIEAVAQLLLQAVGAFFAFPSRKKRHADGIPGAGCR